MPAPIITPVPIETAPQGLTGFLSLWCSCFPISKVFSEHTQQRVQLLVSLESSISSYYDNYIFLVRPVSMGLRVCNERPVSSNERTALPVHAFLRIGTRTVGRRKASSQHRTLPPGPGEPGGRVRRWDATLKTVRARTVSKS